MCPTWAPGLEHSIVHVPWQRLARSVAADQAVAAAFGLREEELPEGRRFLCFLAWPQGPERTPQQRAARGQRGQRQHSVGRRCAPATQEHAVARRTVPGLHRVEAQAQLL